MNRRHFVAASALLIGAGCATGQPPADADAVAIKQVVADYYETYFRTLDKDKYRALLTDDYVLLENGELEDAAHDIASMPAPDSEYKRSDAFDFRSVSVHNDTAYAVYFLRSDMTDKKDGPRHMEWLESVFLRRSGSVWRVALLHSTKIVKPTA
jgi:ketosteroid isomerase-like protein